MIRIELITTGELFDTQPAFLPSLIDGETLFSWAARYHRFSGNVFAKQSSIQLFGDKRAGLRHDFPSHLDRFSEITRCEIGDAETLAYEHTIFGFFAPFLGVENASVVLNQMRSFSVAKVKSALGLLPSRLGGFFPLKACPDCIREELATSHISRWHLEHQWPSVWICREHRTLLKVLKREFQSKDLRRWLLPEDIVAGEWLESKVSASDAEDRLVKLAEISAHFAQCRGHYFDHQSLRYVYLRRAFERGWLYTDGSLKLAQIRQLFLEFYSGIEMLPGFEVIQSVKTDYGGMLGLLMHQYDWKRHPVKHFLLIAFLFDSVADFNSSYERVCQVQSEGGNEALEEFVGENFQPELKRLVEVEHKSLSSAAATLGMTLRVAIRVARQTGIKYQRRARVVNTALGEKIRKMIFEGLEREQIVLETGIKKSLLKVLMAQDPELRDVWRKKDFERRRVQLPGKFS